MQAPDWGGDRTHNPLVCGLMLITEQPQPVCTSELYVLLLCLLTHQQDWSLAARSGSLAVFRRKAPHRQCAQVGVGHRRHRSSPGHHPPNQQRQAAGGGDGTRAGQRGCCPAAQKHSLSKAQRQLRTGTATRTHACRQDGARPKAAGAAAAPGGGFESAFSCCPLLRLLWPPSCAPGQTGEPALPPEAPGEPRPEAEPPTLRSGRPRGPRGSGTRSCWEPRRVGPSAQPMGDTLAAPCAPPPKPWELPGSLGRGRRGDSWSLLWGQERLEAEIWGVTSMS